MNHEAYGQGRGACEPVLSNSFILWTLSCQEGGEQLRIFLDKPAESQSMTAKPLTVRWIVLDDADLIRDSYIFSVLGGHQSRLTKPFHFKTISATQCCSHTRLKTTIRIYRKAHRANDGDVELDGTESFSKTHCHGSTAWILIDDYKQIKERFTKMNAGF